MSKDKIAELVYPEGCQVIAQAILDLIAHELPKEEECKHNSIPCYYDGADEGCYRYMKNVIIKAIKHKLEV